MKLTTKEFTIRDLVCNGVIAIDDDNIKRHYDGNNLGRVIDEKDAKYDNLGGDADGLGLILKDGTICVRPPYQRGEAWNPKQQMSLIKSVYEGYPLTSIFFADVKEDKDNPYEYEVVDGQQRLTSLCKYVNGHLSLPSTEGPIKGFFENVSDAQRELFLNQKIFVNSVVYDTYKEKVKHFEIINSGNTKLEHQEIRNASYYGPFVEALRQHFGKRSGSACKAQTRGWHNKYIDADVVHQQLTEIALEWQILKEDFETTKELYNKLKSGDHEFTYNIMHERICDYMSKHKDENNCEDVWNTFVEINEWIEKVFIAFTNNSKVLKIMKNVKNWAWIYLTYKDVTFYPAVIADNVNALFANKEEYRNVYNIFEYVLLCLSVDENDREEVAQQHFNMMDTRRFGPDIKHMMYRDSGGICPDCKEHFDEDKMEAHHIVSWARGGRTVSTNCALICKDCHTKRHY